MRSNLKGTAVSDLNLPAVPGTEAEIVQDEECGDRAGERSEGGRLVVGYWAGRVLG